VFWLPCFQTSGSLAIRTGDLYHRKDGRPGKPGKRGDGSRTTDEVLDPYPMTYTGPAAQHPANEERVNEKVVASSIGSVNDLLPATSPSVPSPPTSASRQKLPPRQLISRSGRCSPVSSSRMYLERISIIKFTCQLATIYAALSDDLLASRAGKTALQLADHQSDLDQLIAERVPPTHCDPAGRAASKRASYFVDSGYRLEPIQGEKVETAFVLDLIPHIDATYRTLPTRSARAIAGYSMGGYAATRYPLAHPELFSAAIILSPAVYIPLPPSDSSARQFGLWERRGHL
jgi:hypothetical protein